MKKFIKHLFIICEFLFILSGCKQTKHDPCPWFSKPSSFWLRIGVGNNSMSDDDLQKLKLRYSANGETKYFTGFSPCLIDPSYKDKGLILVGWEIGLLSAKSNLKEFYIEYPNGWREDTLYVDYLPQSPETNCQCIQNEIRVNGVKAAIDSQMNPPAYIIDKPK